MARTSTVPDWGLTTSRRPLGPSHPQASRSIGGAAGAGPVADVGAMHPVRTDSVAYISRQKSFEDAVSTCVLCPAGTLWVAAAAPAAPAAPPAAPPPAGL